MNHWDTCKLCGRRDCEARDDSDLHCLKCRQEINAGPGVCPQCAPPHGESRDVGLQLA